EKAHYNGLADDKKDEFLNKSAEDRKTILAKAAEGDPVVYKAEDGTEYRKSAGEQMIALAKKADEAVKTANAEKAARENSELKKRAEETFKNLPGTVDEKAALLKAVESIPDEKAREAALKSIKAGDSALAAAFTRKGAGGGNTPETDSANEQLNTMAKKYATDNKVSFEKA